MFFADLHIHSRFSRATSRDCDLPHLEWWALRKGIRLIGTGDFTHPLWRAELKEQLVPAEEGLYRLREEMRLPGIRSAESPRFLVTGEISSIYKRDGKTRMDMKICKKHGTPSVLKFFPLYYNYRSHATRKKFT